MTGESGFTMFKDGVDNPGNAAKVAWNPRMSTDDGLADGPTPI